MLDITQAFSIIWEEFVYFVAWERAHGISVTIGGDTAGASFFTLNLAAYVIMLVLSYIPPFDEGVNDYD